MTAMSEAPQVSDTDPSRRSRTPARSMSSPLSPTTKWALRLASVIAIALAWELYGRSVNPVLLSSPTAIVRAFVEMIADGTLTRALGESLVVLGAGSLIGVTAGLAIGLAAGRNQVFATLIEVPLNALYATPSVALIPSGSASDRRRRRSW
jgi:NitT/TauT family transport system permease protein